MTPFLEKRGIEVIESDLGERIQQLDGQPPSHIVSMPLGAIPNSRFPSSCAPPKWKWWN